MRNTYFYIFKFFTTWSVLLVVFHVYTHKYINLLYISFITLFIGLYMSFINPRKFVLYFENERYEYTGWQKFIIVDMIFHLSIFYFIYTRYHNYYTTSHVCDVKFITALLLLLSYTCLFNVKRLYGVGLNELVPVFMIATIAYILALTRKSST